MYKVSIQQVKMKIPAQAPHVGSLYGSESHRLIDHRTGVLDRYFYLFMSGIILVVVTYGFSHTAGDKLIHAVPRRPWVLYAHAVIFYSWVLLLVLQSAMVCARRVHWHRRIGALGAALGGAMCVLGFSTAVIMGRFNIANFHARYPEGALLISFFDITAFMLPFLLAILWRRKPELHRRLQIVASCALTAAAFGRLPMFSVTPGAHHNRVAFAFAVWASLYAGVDVLIFLGVLRDWLANRHVHAVFAYSLAAFVAGQTALMYMLFTREPAWWLAGARALLRG